MRIGSSGNLLAKQETERGKEKRPKTSNLFSTFMPMIISPLTGQIKQTELQKNILDQEIMAKARSWGEVQLNPHLLEDEPYALHVDTNEDGHDDSLEQLAQHDQSEAYKFRTEKASNQQPVNPTIKHEQQIPLHQPSIQIKDLIPVERPDSQPRNIRKVDELTPVLPVKVEDLSPIQDSSKVLQLFKVKGLVPNDTLNQTTITKISELIPFDKLNELDSKKVGNSEYTNLQVEKINGIPASRQRDQTTLENGLNQRRMNNLPAIDKDDPSENMADKDNSYHVSTVSNPLPIKIKQLVPVNKLQEIEKANQLNSDLHQNHANYASNQPIETGRDKDVHPEAGMHGEHDSYVNSHEKLSKDWQLEVLQVNVLCSRH